MFKIQTKLLFVICTVWLPYNSMAQKTNSTSKKTYFQSYNTVLLLTGSSATTAAIHTVNGFRSNSFFGGVGVGLDYYYHTSIPIFAQARYNLTNKERKFQVFANGGIHLPFSNKNRQQPDKIGPFKMGLLLEAGVEYFIPLKKDAIVFGVSFNQKKVTQMVENNVWDPTTQSIINIPIKEEYQFNRIAVRLGVVF